MFFGGMLRVARKKGYSTANTKANNIGIDKLTKDLTIRKPTSVAMAQ